MIILKDLLLDNDGDIIINSTDDLADITKDKDLILGQLIEMFDMSYGDDIDFPFLFSAQREAIQTENRQDRVARINNAKKIIAQHPLINKDNIDVGIISGKLKVKFQVVEDRRFLL